MPPHPIPKPPSLLPSHKPQTPLVPILKPSTPHSPRHSTTTLPTKPPFHRLSLLSSLLPSPAAALSDPLPPPSKIDVESVLLAVDDFFNRNPFFVSGVVFIWLVAIPLAQEYFKKCKAVPAIDAFRKLRGVPECRLLDIRGPRSSAFMAPPDLRILGKGAAHVEYREGDEERFLREVAEEFGDPANTVVCVLDSFDGDSLKVAELLYKNGFKEAYAIKGGLRGKDGWQAIQETFLPPSTHVYPRKKKKSKAKSKLNIQEKDEQNSSNGRPQSSPSIQQDKSLIINNGSVKSTDATRDAQCTPERPSSPFPNYPDLKPPSSPTPSKPQT